MQDIEDAKKVLKKNGYYIDNLWQIADVLQSIECSEKQAYDILDLTLNNDYLISETRESINVIAKSLGHKIKNYE